jgi:hypothetical protein
MQKIIYFRHKAEVAELPFDGRRHLLLKQIMNRHAEPLCPQCFACNVHTVFAPNCLIPL